MQDTEIQSVIQASQSLRQRAEAIIQTDRWNDENADVFAYIPIEQVMWCVASVPAIRAVVAQEAGDGDLLAVQNACNAVNDNDLSYVVLTLALPRIKAAQEAASQGPASSPQQGMTVEETQAVAENAPPPAGFEPTQESDHDH